MTLVEAYNKYNNLKLWYDSKTEAFLYRIAVIDAKIEELKQQALSAVGTALEKITNAIQKWMDRITKVIQALQEFVTMVEEKIKNWITEKIAEITNTIAKKLEQAVKTKAEASVAAATGLPQVPETEEPEEIQKIDYTAGFPSMPDVPKETKTISITELSQMAEKYGSNNIDSLPFESKNFKLSDYCNSSLAKRKNISNTPSEEHRLNLQALNKNVVDPLIEKLGSNILSINSGYRSPELNKAIGGAATSQHSKGEAVDLHVKTGNFRRVFSMLIDMDFDQLIWEHEGLSKWIHVSYKRNGRNRKEVLDWNGQVYKKIPKRNNQIVFAYNNIPNKIA